MKVKIILFLIVSTLVQSCSSKELIHIRLADTGGLSPSNSVSMYGISIGKVKYINRSNSDIIISLEVNKDVEIPIDSKYQVKEIDLLGNKKLSILPGESEEFIGYSDTINGNIVTKKILNSFERPISNFLDDLTNKNTQDSILIELRRLNENLEKNNLLD